MTNVLKRKKKVFFTPVKNTLENVKCLKVKKLLINKNYEYLFAEKKFFSFKTFEKILSLTGQKD